MGSLQGRRGFSLIILFQKQRGALWNRSKHSGEQGIVRAREPRGVKAIRVAHASGVLVSASRRNRLSKNSRLDKDVSCQEKVCDRQRRSPARRRRVLPQVLAHAGPPEV